MSRNEKHKMAQHEWYLRNKELTYNRTKERRLKIYEWYNDYKSHCTCSECGLTGMNNFCTLQFHHINPDNKDFQIADWVRKSSKITALLIELEKTICLCANCHRKLHAKEINISKRTKSQIKRREWYDSFKSNLICEDCGEKDIRCLDMHHLENKEYSVSWLVSQGRNVNVILAELDKCVCLCANCHIKRHNK